MALPGTIASSHNFYPLKQSTVPGLCKIFAKLTVAADMEVDGITVTDGISEVSRAVRADEGVIRLYLKDPCYKLINAHAILSIADYQPFISGSSFASDPSYVDITFQLFGDSTGAATDPDSAVIYVVLWVQSSSIGV